MCPGNQGLTRLALLNLAACSTMQPVNVENAM
jgi:hypothetical protein